MKPIKPKLIWVAPATHTKVKTQASKRGMSVKDYVEWLVFEDIKRSGKA